MTPVATASTLVPLILSIAMLTGLATALIMARVLRPARHLQYWAAASFLMAVGFFLFGMRGTLPDGLSVLLSNLLFIVGYGMTQACFGQLADPPRPPDWGLTLTFCGLFIGAYLIDATVNDRVLLISVGIVVFSVLWVRVLLRSAATVAPLAARLGAAVAAVNAAIGLGRMMVASGVTGLSPGLGNFLIGPGFMAATVFVITAMHGAVGLMTLEAMQGNLQLKIQELEQSRARLTETLAERRNVTEMLTHEFNSGLNRIGSSVEVLAGTRLSAGASEELALIRRTVRRMSDQIDDVLGSASIEEVIATPDFVLLSARDIAQELCREYRIECETMPDGPDLFEGDRVLVQIALSSVIENAQKYSGDARGTALRVDLGPQEVAFTVTDTGAGIPVAERARVFEKYYRGHGGRQTKGSGLGLYFSQRIAARHGGSISVATTPSRVTLRFSRTAARHHDIAA